MVLLVGLTTVLQATVFGSLDPSLVGLALSYVLLVCYDLSWFGIDMNIE